MTRVERKNATKRSGRAAARRSPSATVFDLMAAFDNAPNAVALFDAEDRLSYANRAVMGVYHSLTMEERPYGALYESLLRWLVENGEFAGEQVLRDPEAWIAWRLDCHRTGGGPVEERLADGRWLDVVETRLDNGGCLVQWTDVTGERRAQLAMQDGVESMAEGMAVWDQSGRLMYYNTRFAEWLGSAERPVHYGHTLRQILDDLCASGRVRTEETPRAWVNKCLTARAQAAAQYAIAYADGSHVLVRERRTRSGGYATVLLDITELHRQEQELIHRGNVLERANSELELTRTALENQATTLAGMAEELAAERDRANRALVKAEEAGEQLRAIAFVDPLTGAYNRRAFFEAAEREVLRASRYGHPLSVLVADLDRFKSINDRYGHAAGDMALCNFVTSARQILRDCDVLGRMGGEEFGILLPETGAEAAALAAERLRAALQNVPVSAQGEIFTVTVSIGIAQQAVGRESFEEALERADKALYQAKELGRDRIETAPMPR